MTSSAAAAATAYNDDSILQALRRLPPEELIKHMLETEEWAERLSTQSGAPRAPGRSGEAPRELRATSHAHALTRGWLSLSLTLPPAQARSSRVRRG